MRLGSLKRIISNDYEVDNQPLVEQLGGIINDNTEQLYFAVSGRLTIDENFLATVKDIEVTVGPTGIPTNRTSMLLNNTNTVKGTLVISAVNKTSNTTFPTSSPFISFTQSGTTLFIDNVTGLQANNRYLLRIVALN